MNKKYKPEIKIIFEDDYKTETAYEVEIYKLEDKGYQEVYQAWFGKHGGYCILVKEEE